MYTKYVQFIHPLSNVSGPVHHDRVVYLKKDHCHLIHSRCKTQWLVICDLYRKSKLITKTVTRCLRHVQNMSCLTDLHCLPEKSVFF